VLLIHQSVILCVCVCEFVIHTTTLVRYIGSCGEKLKSALFIQCSLELNTIGRLNLYLLYHCNPHLYEYVPFPEEFMILLSGSAIGLLVPVTGQLEQCLS
jgi:hypothetical protein